MHYHFRKFHITYEDENGQAEIAKAFIEKFGIPNPFVMEEVPFPYRKCPQEGEDGVTVFPLGEIEDYRNSFPIKIPLLGTTEFNLRDLFSLCKGPFVLKRVAGYISLARRREIDYNRDQYESFAAYIDACNESPPRDLKISVVHMKEEPENWHIAVEQGFAAWPTNGILW